MKKRYWAFVVFLDSAPSDWKEQLQQTGLGICISPLHDKDIDPNGETKKAHYHVILAYEGPTTYNNVKRITDMLNQPRPIPLEQVKGYFRYLTHKDNPEKYQYNENEIIELNGFDISQYNDLTKSQIKAMVIEIHKFIIDNQIYEYGDLLDILLKNELWDWHYVASTHTILFHTYLTSKRNKGRRGQ